MRRFDRAALQVVRERLEALPRKRFDRMLPMEQRKQIFPEDVGEYERRAQRKAAVAIPLLNFEGAAGVLFTVRSTRVGTHGGQVSFPGGHVEETEVPEQAAVRELMEETAIHPAGFDVLGRWHDVRAITGTMVSPVVGFVQQELGKADLDGMVEAAGSSEEVDSCFVLTLQELLDPKKQTVENLRGYRMPRFTAGPQPVWGLTAFILGNVLRDTGLQQTQAGPAS